MNTTITIPVALKQELKQFGTKGETYADILVRLLNSAKKRQLQELLMDESDCLPIEEALEKAKNNK